MLEEGGLRVEVKPQFVNHFGASTIFAKFDNALLDVESKVFSMREALQVLFNGSTVELDV